MRPIDMKGVPLRSLAEMLQRRVSQTPGELAYQIRDGDGWRDLNWSQFGDSVSQIARGLLALGVLPGDRCAILVGTRLEWIAIDFGILTAGCATTTIYRSSTPDDCRYILHDSGARVCFVENQEQLQKILAVREKLPNLTAVILVDGESGAEKVYGLAELKTMAVPNAKLEETIAAIRPTDLACLIYTSGTTGEPKGVMLTHGSFLAMTQAVEDRSKNYQDEKQLLFLPLAHVFGKVCELTSVYVGVPTAIDGDLERLVDTMAEVRPTIMAAVPRVFEKCFNIVVRRARQAGSRKFRVFQWALRIGRRVSVFQQNRKKLPFALRLQYALADRLVFSKVRAAFGGRLETCVSGGAPLSIQMAEFFHACGILVLEGYGLTETAAVATVNDPEAYRFGTVGLPAPGVELMIADDGEILIRTPSLMVGYYGKPERTKEVIKEGWFHSGDIGTIDDDGFLTITDRKKNLIVTSGGKNIAPQKIENLVRTSTDLISQILVHGDRRNFCVALITLDMESVAVWAEEQGVKFRSPASRMTELRQVIQRHIDEVNAALPQHERLKDLLILDRDFTVESGELTQSLKLRRSVIETNYRRHLDDFYESAIEESAF